MDWIATVETVFVDHADGRRESLRGTIRFTADPDEDAARAMLEEGLDVSMLAVAGGVRVRVRLDGRSIVDETIRAGGDGLGRWELTPLAIDLEPA